MTEQSAPDIVELERAAIKHFMAGFNGRTFPLRESLAGSAGQGIRL
jgi:hypothetical protein